MSTLKPTGSILQPTYHILIAIILTILTTSHESDTHESSNTLTCDYYLSQIDINFGTYRIRNPGLYCLTKDLIFNPLPPDDDLSAKSPNSIDPLSWFPKDNQSYPGCNTLSNGPFALGFFSVITIESDDIIINLNGYKISYHFDFYLQQRFGSIIEISNQYTHLGTIFKPIQNITIKNGELGLTSHHGIHSTYAANVIIQNMKIYDFEVAGIQLNRFQNAQILNVDIGPSLQTVSLTGTNPQNWCHITSKSVSFASFDFLNEANYHKSLYTVHHTQHIIAMRDTYYWRWNNYYKASMILMDKNKNI